MNKTTESFGQSDIVRLSDEDARVALLERAVTGLWEVVNELTRLRRWQRRRKWLTDIRINSLGRLQGFDRNVQPFRGVFAFLEKPNLQGRMVG
jgi:hypothetical protein